MNPFRRNTLWLLWSVLALAALVIHGSRWLWSAKLYLRYGIAADIHDTDFVNYWLGSRLALSGEHLLLFDHDAWLSRLQQLFGAEVTPRTWSSPPHLLLLIWPLGLLPYVAALTTFLGITLSAFVAAAVATRNALLPKAPLALVLLAISGCVWMALDATQIGLLTGTLMLLALLWKDQRPALAGLSLALLTIKPQLGFMLPLLLVADRNWRTLAWAAVFTLGLVALSAVIFGVAPWWDYITRIIPDQGTDLFRLDGDLLAMMPGTVGSLRILGLGTQAAMAIQAAVSLAALALVTWLLFRRGDALLRMFAALAGTFLISPYAFNHDMGALAVIAALLAIRTQAGARTPEAVLIALVAALPGLIFQLGRAGMPVAPLVLAFGLVAAARLSLRPPPNTAGRVPPLHAAPTPAPG